MELWFDMQNSGGFVIDGAGNGEYLRFGGGYCFLIPTDSDRSRFLPLSLVLVVDIHVSTSLFHDLVNLGSFGAKNARDRTAGHIDGDRVVVLLLIFDKLAQGYS